MTPQEIQALINAKIAGQGSAVDVGGALPQILSGILELAQAGADAPKPLFISGVPNDGDTLEDLINYGFTFSEIKAASEGKRSCVVLNGSDFYVLTNAQFSSEETWSIAFEKYRRETDSVFLSISSYTVQSTAGVLAINSFEL